MRAFTAFGSLGLALCLAHAQTVPSTASSPAQPRADELRLEGYEHELVRVDEGVWALAQAAFHVQPAGNVTVVEQADGFVLVDTGGSPGAARRVLAQVRALGDKPIKAVVLTHWHGDHVLGLEQLLAAWPDARTLASEATRAHLAEPATMNVPAELDAQRNASFVAQIESYVGYSRQQASAATTSAEREGWDRSALLFERYTRDVDGAVTLQPAEGVAKELLLDDPERPVLLRFLGRGNTDGDLIAWLPRQRVLVSGDLLVLPVPFGFGSYPAEWMDVLGRLAALEPRVIVPGHGRPQQGTGALLRLRDALGEVRAQVAPLAEAGLELEQVRARVELGAQAERFVGADPWLRHWYEAYWCEPIVGSAFHEARGEPIVQGLGGG